MRSSVVCAQVLLLLPGLVEMPVSKVGAATRVFVVVLLLLARRPSARTARKHAWGHDAEIALSREESSFKSTVM